MGWDGGGDLASVLLFVSAGNGSGFRSILILEPGSLSSVPSICSNVSLKVHVVVCSSSSVSWQSSCVAIVAQCRKWCCREAIVHLHEHSNYLPVASLGVLVVRSDTFDLAFHG